MNEQTVDGRLLKSARDRLSAMREKNEQELEAHRLRAYAANPAVRDLENSIRASMANLISAALSGGDIAAVRERNRAMQSSLRNMLVSSGFPADYLDMHYMCEKCGDSGYIGTEMCSCLKALYNEERTFATSGLYPFSGASFDAFDLGYYDDSPDNNARTHMEAVRDLCMMYAQHFGSASKNLFFTGGTGLGKTFLSACIAKVVSENGFFVIYDTAGNVFSKLEAEKFGRGYDELYADTQRYYSCDLLILDDLGTEMTTSFTVSALYNIVNTRLINGKKTIINSNLVPEDIAKRYSSQIASRILGEYEILRFIGSDIRLLKKDRR